ncbi:hypothetical protein TCDM_07936 [Trypanosoma cruzi Dm28c]|uniref:Uncharacterized protein n=1 Tax=Trypanosoma cruzi Dm28c TaxID=1416333 RepID=V5B901_TRYCR|nr:hypothetical protein TCDM_07936 [Trypanosoma cruzi Dm28c]
MILLFATTPLKWLGVVPSCSTALTTTRAIWPHRMIALRQCQRQLNPQRSIPARRLHHHTGMLLKGILVRRGVARRGTHAPFAMRRRLAVPLHDPGPPRHMLKARKQMGVERQSTVSDQLLPIGLLQLVGAARSHKQREKKQTHWPGHRRIPRQVPHAIQVFHEEFCAQRRCLVPPSAPPPVASPSTVPQASRKYRCAATVRLASPETPAKPAPLCSTPQDWPSAPRPAPIPDDTRGVFSAPPKAPSRTAQENNDGTSASTHPPHQLLPL